MDLIEAGEIYIEEHPKVYCDQCVSYRDMMMHKGDRLTHRCEHPDVMNHSRMTDDCPITKGCLQEWTYPGNCVVINKFNDCPLFKQLIRPDRSEMKS